MFRTLSWVVLFWLAALSASAQESEAVAALAKKLRSLEPHKLVGKEAEQSAEKYIDDRLRKANVTSSADWAKITTRKEWEEFRKRKLYDLRESLHLPDRRGKATIHVVGELPGDGYKIQKLIYQTRPHWFVTANLYLPEKPLASGMPGIILSHSHHNPKTQGELQDMGATWARVGCAVLVPDHLGHGERRQHPFATSKDFEREFAVGRQDYHLRYDTSIQLYLAGESLMGWMVHDLMGGVDVLLAQKNIDPKKIALLGAVAGGGDPAAVTAALDERIALAAPFNFGGPQPETRYPLPDDAETWFNYAGGGGWESTRNLADSVYDGGGFLPWEIVGGIAPRKLIYGHEFSWDRERDPVWKRFEKIWGFYAAKNNLGFAHGRGTLRGMPPEASHCDNIGPIHRSMIHPLLAKWFGVPVTEKDEYKARRDAKELWCWTPELKKKLQPKLLHEMLAERRVSVPMVLGGELKKEWSERLGPCCGKVKGGYPRKLDTSKWEFPQASLWLVEEDGVDKSVLILSPSKPRADKALVVAVAQAGMRGFLTQRSEEIAKLMEAGVSVALVDVRHTGTSTDRGQYGDLTSYSASYLMLDDTLIGAQLLDLQSAIAFLGGELHTDKILLWGESFAEPLAADAKFNYPRRIDRPEESDPLGALLVTYAAYFDNDVRAVYARGMISDYAGAFKSPFVQMPHSVLLRDVLSVGDLPYVRKNIEAKTTFPNLIDGLNRRLEQDDKVKVKSPSAWLIEAL